ncbi:YhcH/YjgK/YiaL family protein [Providencia rettgeri]|uniref:YhcH/YjgK/YiaL family protein n=1 Tax=Providencia rettgeri TaxID=587 RepID=UPI001B35FE44|nr:YhcH/YjgK/YiaL family protein [Providencia rettgeri]MBQ0366626.1 YhcH/YjgK/YiaL family protein [Providencia rettgeri]
MILQKYESLINSNVLPISVRELLSQYTINDLRQLNDGFYSFDGMSSDDINLTRKTLRTESKENRVIEMHTNYIDIHIPLTGCEKILISIDDNIGNVCFASSEKEDYKLFKYMDFEKKVILSTGDALVIFPGELHATQLDVDKSKELAKVIIKIRYDKFY